MESPAFGGTDQLRDILVLVGGNLAAFAFASLFFAYFIFRDYEVKNYGVQAAFAVVFTLGTNSFVLVIFEILDILQAPLRHTMMQLDVAALSFMLLVALPLFFVVTLFREQAWTPRRVFTGTAVTYLLFLLAIYELGAAFPLSVSSSAGVSEQVVGRLGIVGITVIAVLSGFGSVNSPYSMVIFFLNRVDESEVKPLERRLMQTVEMALSKKRRVAHALRTHRRGLESGSLRPAPAPLWRRALAALGGPKPETSATPASALALLREAEGMEDFARDLFLELSDLRQEQARARYARTLPGRLQHLLGLGLSVYCIAQIALKTRTIVFSLNPTVDPVTRFIEWFLFLLRLDVDAALLSQQISFLFIGCVVCVSVRGFLVTIMKLFHSLSTAVSSNSVMLLLAEALGLFFVSNIVLMRMKLPEQYRSLITDALGDVHFNFFYRWFDVLFMLSAVASAVVIFFLHKSRNARIGAAATAAKLQ